MKVVLTSGDDNIIIASQDGYAVSFQETNVRSMGRTATGVRGIRLNDGDQVVGMSVLGPDDNVLVVTEKGYGKQTPASEYGIKNRGGKGVKTINVTEKNGILVGLTTVSGEEDIMLMTNQGVAIRFHAKNISQTGRATQGVRLIRLSDEAVVSTITKVDAVEEENLVVTPVEGEPTADTTSADAPSEDMVSRMQEFADDALSDQEETED